MEEENQTPMCSLDPFGYLFDMDPNTITQKRKSDLKDFVQRHKKLHLVLDLDHTLLHSLRGSNIAPSQLESLKSSSKEIYTMDGNKIITKLRPYVHTFLEEASKLFELYIYTMSDRKYATKIAEFLDPQQEYFCSRVITQEESTKLGQKGLDLIPAHESSIIILDDSECVWREEDRKNLIQMEKYEFFMPDEVEVAWDFELREFITVPAGVEVSWDFEVLKKNYESETDGALARVLEILKQVYNVFFSDGEEGGGDVRDILKSILM